MENHSDGRIDNQFRENIMGQYLGYDPRMAICGIVVLPVLIWWFQVKASNKVKWFGYLMILFFAQVV